MLFVNGVKFLVPKRVVIYFYMTIYTLSLNLMGCIFKDHTLFEFKTGAILTHRLYMFSAKPGTEASIQHPHTSAHLGRPEIHEQQIRVNYF